MKKLYIILLALAVCPVWVLSGCSGGESSVVETTAAQTTAPVEETTVDVYPATTDSADGEITYDSVEIKQNVAKIEAKLDSLTAGKRFQGSVYAKVGNDFEYLKSSGTANDGEHKENSLYTRFYTGSITKQLTAAAVLKLRDEKKLDLSSTLKKYFPDCAYAGKVTIAQLLNMTSGIPNYVDRNSTDKLLCLSGSLNSKINSKNSLEENKSAVLNWILSQKLRSDAGTFNFSDSNYYLLGCIVEKVSKKSYEEYMNSTFFSPLLMTKSGYMSDDFTAKSYTGNAKSAKLLYEGVGFSSLGFITNVSDLLKWCEGLRTYKVLGEKSVMEILTDYGDGYGYGVYVDGKKVSATGRVDAFSAKLSFSLDGSEIFAALSNHRDSDPNFIHRMFKNYLKIYRN